MNRFDFTGNMEPQSWNGWFVGQRFAWRHAPGNQIKLYVDKKGVWKFKKMKPKGTTIADFHPRTGSWKSKSNFLKSWRPVGSVRT